MGREGGEERKKMKKRKRTCMLFKDMIDEQNTQSKQEISFEN